MKKIIIASSNSHKIKEIALQINPFFESILSLKDFPEIKEIVEDGNTLKENSYLKSSALFQHSGIASLGDDTGLEVDFLHGEPGVFSARYAGGNATDDDNLQKLLQNMKSASNRSAIFKTVISFVDGQNDFFVEGILRGEILHSPKGANGFGYDSIFYIPTIGKTLAEMSIEEKSITSHRALAMEKFLKEIQKIF